MVAPYLKPDWRRAAIQLLNTGLPFVLAMAAILFGIRHGVWWVLLLVPVTAFLVVRLFMFQHDCGHGSFFPSWRGDHAIHHASAGNLDRRGVGDITTLTLEEYLALTPRRRLGYRLYRHPLVMFGIGPAWLFLVTQRIPVGNPRRRWRDWLSVLGTDAALLAGAVLVVVLLGPLPLLLGWLPVVLTAATIGIWLFYVQHQFEDAYWQPKPSWDFAAAAVQGSSFYDLPRPLHWLTGNIGFHHIHHLSSRIPNYRLRDCHEANPELQKAPRLSIRHSFRCTRLALWDAQRRKLVSFRSVRALVPGRHDPA